MRLDARGFGLGLPLGPIESLESRLLMRGSASGGTDPGSVVMALK